MKNLKYLIALCLFINISCSESTDDLTDQTASYFAGQWNLTEFSSTEGRFNVTIGTNDIAADFTSIGKNYGMTVFFNETPNTISTTGTFTNEMTVVIGGNTIVEDISMDDLNLSGNWTAENNILSVDSNGEISTYKIIASSQNTLKLEYTITDQTINYDGEDIVVSAIGFITLTKE